MQKVKKILVIEDEPGLQQVLRLILRSEGYDVVSAVDGVEGVSRFVGDPDIDLVLTDVRLPGLSGLEILKRIKTHRSEVPCIVMSAYSSIELAVEAMREGAWHFISKPFKKDVILNLLRRLEEHEEVVTGARRPAQRNAPQGAPRIVGVSEEMQRILTQLERVAGFGSAVLLQGESGTGKELLARHYHAAAGGGPYVAVNCGAIPGELLESELFGHVKGAFTGAHSDKEGLIPAATGGTLFLDEIGDLPLALQVKLLRVLQENRVRPVGGLTERNVSFRLVSATARDLAAEVAAGRFREDLFYRLNVVPVVVPPLRQRPEDIEPLARYFLEGAAERMGAPVKTLAPETLEALRSDPLRGNVRELENLMERLALLVEDCVIRPSDLPGPVRSDLPEEAPGDLSIKRATRDLERKLIVQALRLARGRKGKAAEMLEISTRALLYKIKEYNIMEW